VPRIVIQSDAGQRELLLPEGTTTAVGRGPSGNALRLEERNVSRRHACFHVTGGAVSVEDLGSRTGTFVNGERLAGRRRLLPGDHVRIGDFDLVLDDAAVTAPPDTVTGEAGLPPPIPNRSTPRAAPTQPLRPPSRLRRAAAVALRAVERLRGGKG
jgi:pSer/pThr/pTyr-binding forkhead associated (FHA) protein